MIVEQDIEAAGLHRLAVKKMTDFNTDLAVDGPHALIYPDSTEVINIPGSSKPFTLGAYRNENRTIGLLSIYDLEQIITM